VSRASGGTWTVYDNFNDNRLNLAIWQLNDGAGGVLPTEVGNRILFAAGANSSLRTTGKTGGNILGFRADVTPGAQVADNMVIQVEVIDYDDTYAKRTFGDAGAKLWGYLTVRNTGGGHVNLEPRVAGPILRGGSVVQFVWDGTVQFGAPLNVYDLGIMVLPGRVDFLRNGIVFASCAVADIGADGLITLPIGGTDPKVTASGPGPALMDNAQVMYTPKTVSISAFSVSGNNTTGSLAGNPLTFKATGDPLTYRVYGFAVGGAEITLKEGNPAAPVGGVYTITGVDITRIPLVSGKRTVWVKASNEVSSGTAKAAVALVKPTIAGAMVNGSNTTGSYTQNTLTFTATKALQYKIQAQRAGSVVWVDLVPATPLPLPDAKGVYTIVPVDLSTVVEVKGKRTLQVTTMNEAGSSVVATVGVTLVKPTIAGAKVNGSNTSGTYTQNTLTFTATKALQYKIQAQRPGSVVWVDLVPAAALPLPDAKGVYTIVPVDLSAVVEVKGKRTLQVTTMNDAGSSLAASVGVTMLTPTIASLTPASSQFIGEVVTLKGSGFGPGGRTSGTVTFNGVRADVSSWSDSTIVCTVPVGATSGKVKVTSAEMPKSAEKTYDIYPSPVGAWDLTYSIGTNQHGSVRIFIAKEGGRYFYLEDAEGIGEFMLGVGGKMTGKVYWFDGSASWDDESGALVSQSEVLETDTWSLTFGKAEAGKHAATFSATVTFTGGKATGTAQRDEGVDTSAWTWPLHQVQVGGEIDLNRGGETRVHVMGLVLVPKQVGVDPATEAVLMSVGANPDILLSQPQGLPSNLPFSVWFAGLWDLFDFDLTVGGEVILAGRNSEITVPLSPLPNPPEATGATPLPGSVVRPGVLPVVGFSYTGALSGNTGYGLWVQDINADNEVFGAPLTQAVAGTIGGTIPAGVLANGKVYRFNIGPDRPNRTLNQAYFDLEFLSSFMVSATAPDSRYSVYYTKSVINGWEDYKGARWVSLGANLSGVRTLTVPVGATAIKIQTNARTVIDAVVMPGLNLWFETYWDDYWDRIAFDQDYADPRTVDSKCWYLLGNGTYLASRFHIPLPQATNVTITP
jgi:hypothetical protein